MIEDIVLAIWIEGRHDVEPRANVRNNEFTFVLC
jgi:hypothetical protein